MKKQYLEVDAMREVLKDNLSPEAVALVAARLQMDYDRKLTSAERQAEWFRKFLVDMVGGANAVKALLAEDAPARKALRAQTSKHKRS